MSYIQGLFILFALPTAEGTTTDTRAALNESQCIEVSINRFCNESADSFQAQLQYMERRNDTTSAESSILRRTFYALDENYTTCVPITETEKNVYYSAQVYHNGVVVGRTEPQQLILLPCNTSSLNLQDDIVVYSIPVGAVNLGDEVVHNSVLFFVCRVGCDLSGPNQTRCVNGTLEFELSASLNSSVQCTCTPGKGI